MSADRTDFDEHRACVRRDELRPREKQRPVLQAFGGEGLSGAPVRTHVDVGSVGVMWPLNAGHDLFEVRERDSSTQRLS